MREVAPSPRNLRESEWDEQNEPNMVNGVAQVLDFILFATDETGRGNQNGLTLVIGVA